MKITIIGGGNMGQAFAKGLSGRDLSLTVSDPDVSKIEYLEDLGINVTNKNQEAIESAEIIVLAVKPNILHNVLTDLKCSDGVLIVSIAAGITVKQVMAWSSNRKIVRVMPNTPALVGRGISGWFCSEAVTDEEKLGVQQLLETIGDEVELEEESMLDIVTAMSGSGPAYVFYFLDAMVDAAEEMGMEREMAEKLATKTFIGSTMLAEASQEDYGLLRERVTSKGGTTEAAIAVMEAGKMHDIFMSAIKRAAERAKELRGE